MINDTIHTIWPGWKVVDKIGNDSRDMLYSQMILLIHEDQLK